MSGLYLCMANVEIRIVTYVHTYNNLVRTPTQTLKRSVRVSERASTGAAYTTKGLLLCVVVGGGVDYLHSGLK